MKVLNVHKRVINQPKARLVELLKTLASENDGVWPKSSWPKISFKGGIKVGASGGHGPIRYSIEKYKLEEVLQFRFSKPEGFNGIHKFELEELSNNRTHIKHTIDMSTSGTGTLKWILAIRSLHDALIEDCFDNIENHFSKGNKKTEWSFWVVFLRKLLA